MPETFLIRKSSEILRSRQKISGKNTTLLNCEGVVNVFKAV